MRKITVNKVYITGVTCSDMLKYPAVTSQNLQLGEVMRKITVNKVYITGVSCSNMLKYPAVTS